MKKSPIHGHLLEKLIEVYQGSLDPELTDFRIPTTVYTDESRLQAERRLLRALPMAVAHWELNYELIQNGVFKGGDLWVCEKIQQGLASGANEFLTYGIEEAPIEWWHEELNRRTKELT